MKGKRVVQVLVLLLGLLLGVSAFLYAEAEAPADAPPPIEAPVVREGDFAIELAQSLGITATDDETEAETRLSEFGISPKNGWVADYPVTPDILGELKKAVSDAARARKLSMNEAEALKALRETAEGLGLRVVPAAPNEMGQAGEQNQPASPNQPEANNYYPGGAPPVITYYMPPPYYYGMYTWVGYPFWWGAYWFPGYYILNDFHCIRVRDHHYRHPHHHNGHAYISNHIHSPDHRVIRIDPIRRPTEPHFGGIGYTHRPGLTAGPWNEPPRPKVFGDRQNTGAKVSNPTAAPPPRSGALRPASGTGRITVPNFRNSHSQAAPHIGTARVPSQPTVRAPAPPQRPNNTAPQPRITARPPALRNVHWTQPSASPTRATGGGAGFGGQSRR